jgi:GT2 family glycosyltransferase
MIPLSRPKLSSQVISPDERVEICIPSRGRTINLVCLLQALRTQTFQNWDLTVLDDNPGDAIRSNFTLDALLKLLETEGHRCRVIKGKARGVPWAHNTLLVASKKRLIARIDDDTLPEETHYLDHLVSIFHRDHAGTVGAVGGPIPHFQGGDRAGYLLPDDGSIQQFAPFEAPEVRYLHPAGSRPKRVTALYSSFVHKRDYFIEAGGYALSYSAIAEKEETDMLLRVAFLGAALMFHPDAVLWHLRAPAGGIRHNPDENRQKMFERDYQNFVNRATRLKHGAFDWEKERQNNLAPFEKYRLINDEDRGYIDPT